jgi:hypothetical protein
MNFGANTPMRRPSAGKSTKCESDQSLPEEGVMTGLFRKATIIAVAAAALAAASPVCAKETVAIGQLTCSIKGGSSFIFGSTRELLCTFRAHPGDEGELYEGMIKKYGIDIGEATNTVLIWTVLAPTDIQVEQGVVMGHYVGLAADASLAVGGGANILVGGSNDTISLQPISLQAQFGVNAALGVAEVQLVPYHEDH